MISISQVLGLNRASVWLLMGAALLVTVVHGFAQEDDYCRVASIVEVYDADTVRVDIQLGFGIVIHESVRFWGIDAPEVRGAERWDGLRSRDALLARLGQLPAEAVVCVVKLSDKYGRPVVRLYHRGLDLSEWLVREGHAVEAYRDAR